MNPEQVDSGSFVLSGPVTRHESSDHQEALRSAFSRGMALRIDLETSGPWDLAGLQLLISCTVTGRDLGLPVRLIHVPRVCVEVAERAGLAEWLRDASDSLL